jgi:hypothetical protein
MSGWAITEEILTQKATALWTRLKILTGNSGQFEIQKIKIHRCGV